MADINLSDKDGDQIRLNVPVTPPVYLTPSETPDLDIEVGDFGPNFVNSSTYTDLNGILKGNGANITTAVAGTDYLSPTGSGSGLTGVLKPITNLSSQNANFTATANYKYTVDATSGAVTVTLPSSNVLGQTLFIQKSDSGTNVVNISGTINGTASSTLPLRTQLQGKLLQADGTGNWNVIAGDLSLPALDARYASITGITAGTNVTITGAGTAASPYVINSSGGGGGGTPGGSNTQVQFNNSGAFGGSANFVWDNTNNKLQLGGDTLATLYRSGAGVITTDASLTIGGANLTVNATNMVTDTTTGLKIGTGTTQKLGFFNATPVVQQTATTDLGTVLSNLGLRASGTAYPITTSGAVSLSSGALTLNNGTSNWINYGTAGIGAPAFTTRSVGTKLILYSGLTGSAVDYGFGIESGTLWSSVATTAQQFKWYGGTTLAATLSGAGNLTTVGKVTASGGLQIGSSSTQGQLYYASDTAGNLSATGTNMVWDSTNNSLRIGPTSTAISNPQNRFNVIGDANDFHGIFVQNKNAGTTASTDIVVSNDLADVSTYADFGVNSSTNTNVSFSAFGSGDAYLFTSGSINNLGIAAGSSGKGINFFTGGLLAANLRMAINGSGAVTISTSGQGKTTFNISDTTANTGLTIGGDANIYRPSSGVLRTDGNFGAVGAILSGVGTANQINMFTDGKIYFGSGADTNLYRIAQDWLRTDDQYSSPVLMAGSIDYTTGTISQSGTTTLTGSGTTFTLQMVGGYVVYADGTTNTITGFTSTTQLTTGSTKSGVSAQAYRIIYGGVELRSDFQLPNITFTPGGLTGSGANVSGPMKIYHYADQLLLPTNKQMGLGRAGGTLQLEPSSTQTGDKMGFYGSTLTNRIAMGVQTNRLVASMPSGYSFAIRQTQTSGQATGGTDVITLGVDGSITATGALTALGGSNSYKVINQTAHGFSVGQVVYYNGTAYAVSDNTAASTAEVDGIVTTVNSANQFTMATGKGDYVTGLSSLTANTTYFLGTSGALTATAPSTIGYIRKPILHSDSTTSGYFNNYLGIAVAAAGGGSGIVRSIATFSTTTSAGSTAATDYVYICTANSPTLTLPTAASNTNAYVVKNSGTGTLTVATTSAQTIDGYANLQLTNTQSVTLYSNGSNWVIT